MTLTIVADDLTGACDTGAMFAGRMPVAVTVFPQPRAGAEVAVVDTESRSLPGAEARARVQRLTDTGARPDRWFKKIDSTVRGPLMDELDALLETAHTTGAILCPAFPAQGRTVVQGTVLVGGTPVADTPIGRDPDFRLGGSNLVAALGRLTHRPIERCGLEDLRRGGLGVAPGAVTVCDAVSEADLDAIVSGAMSLPSRPLLVGSAGLAAALAGRLGLHGAAPALPPGARWLIVAGSRHPATAAQIEAARAAGIRILQPPLGLESDRTAVAAELAREARKVLDSDLVDAVAVTGGDTAVALYRELDLDRIDLLGAPAPGLALGRARVSHDRELTLLTKAGGFGAPDLLARLLA